MMDMGGGTMTMSSASSMSTGSQDPGSMSMDSMSSMTEVTNMGSIFFTSTSTPLFTETLRPASAASYAGLCIFLIVLAVVTRCLMALRTILEQKQLDRERKRRYVVVRDQPTEAQNVLADHDSKDGMLITARGPEEKVRVLTTATRPTTAWRFSTDLPRAFLTTVVAGMGYLLMLAVMTFNVGYFLSVLGGIFLGDLAVGRFTAGGGEH